MNFYIDQQTINDLDLFEKQRGEKSIFSLFNFTKSEGGKNRLDFLFSNPLTNLNEIQQRINRINCFLNLKTCFEIDRNSLDFIELYLKLPIVPNRFSIFSSFAGAFNNYIRPKNDYYIKQRSIKYLIDLLHAIYLFSLNADTDKNVEFINTLKTQIRNIIEKSSLSIILKYKKTEKLYPQDFGKLDFLFRNIERNGVREILEIIYEIDSLNSIATAIKKYNLTLPVFSSKANCFDVKGLFHPFIDNPVTNDFEFSTGKNICFLSGPNMAGKSTFLKSISISIYLSHLGFPVPANYFKTSIYNGLLTTINLSDNLNKGYSHFYNEVYRVKFIAERINQIGNLFVIFDELFRGTNVKDAFDASYSVINEFSKLTNSMFAISTHIIEIADKLKDNKSILFNYFEANLINEIPKYNYIIKNGVTDERIGMYILKKEKVIETIRNTLSND